MDTNIVRILSKARGFYVVKSLQRSFADSMHPATRKLIPEQTFNNAGPKS